MTTNQLPIETHTPQTIDRCNRLFDALRIITKIELEERCELDGIGPQSKCTRASVHETYDAVTDAIFRNVFPRATIEQRNALVELDILSEQMERVPKEGILSQAQMDIQHGHEAAKAKVRHLFPLDEVRPMQRYYLETVLLA